MTMFVEGEEFKCFYCSEKYEKKHCDDFIPSSEFMVDCGNRYKSCIQTYGSFNDFSVRGLGCGKGDSADSCSLMEIGRAKATICSCNGTLCNDHLLKTNKSSRIDIMSYPIYFLMMYAILCCIDRFN